MLAQGGHALSAVPWVQALSLANPLTYVSEGLRSSLTRLPHLGSGWIALGLGVSLVLFAVLGTRLFIRRAVD